MFLASKTFLRGDEDEDDNNDDFGMQVKSTLNRSEILKLHLTMY